VLTSRPGNWPRQTLVTGCIVDVTIRWGEIIIGIVIDVRLTDRCETAVSTIIQNTAGYTHPIKSSVTLEHSRLSNSGETIFVLA